MAPKSLPHKISVPGLNALFGGVAAPTPATWGGEPTPPPAPAPVVETPKVEPPPVPKLEVVPPAPVAETVAPPKEKRRASKPVRVTQPESKGNPKGRHTLVIGEDVLDELSLLAWAENMSVSAIAREAFDAYLARRKGVIDQARKLRESFEQPREAV